MAAIHLGREQSLIPVYQVANDFPIFVGHLRDRLLHLLFIHLSARLWASEGFNAHWQAKPSKLFADNSVKLAGDAGQCVDRWPSSEPGDDITSLDGNIGGVDMR